MTIPTSPLPTIAVTGRFVTLANEPANGYVTMTPVAQVAGSGWIVVGATVEALVRDGQLDTTIIADSAALSADLYVRVTERIDDGPVTTYVVQPQGATLDLSTAPRTTEPPPGPLYVPATALGQPGGVATLGPDGILTASQRPSGSGGGVTDHGELTGLADDDHAQYLTVARGDSRYYTQAWIDSGLNAKENVGTASALLSAHTAAADPHPQYTTSGELTTALAPYATTASLTTALAGKENTGTAAGLLAAHTAAADPHPQYATDSDLTTRQPLDADLTTIAGLSPADDTVLQRKSGSWTARTPAQLKTDLGLSNVDNTADADKPLSTATATALAGKVDKSLVDAAGDLLVGSAADTLTRLAKGTDGQVLTVVSGALAYADPAAGGLEADPGDDILALYGYHSATSHISAFDAEFGQNNELWVGRVCVRAGRAINKIGTLVKTAGVLGAGGLNGFAIASDDGATLHYSVDDDNLWTSGGEVSVSLGGSAIPAQPTDMFYRLQLCVQGYSTAPVMLLAGGDHAVLSDFLGRARFANAAAGYQSGGGYDPVTFGSSTGGFYPLIMVG